MIKIHGKNLNAEAAYNLTIDNYFQKLTENSCEGIILLDMNFNVVFRSNSAERIDGWSNETEIKHSLMEVVHPDDKTKLDKFLLRILVNPETPQKITYRTSHYAGYYLWVDCVFSNYLNDPDIGAIVLNFRDVSQERDSGEQLKNSERRHRALLENNSDGISVMSLDGKRLYLSKSFGQILGYTETEAWDLDPLKVTHPDDLDLVALKLKECLDNPGKPIKDINYRIQHKKGHWVYLNGTFTNFLSDPAIGGIVINFRDVTEEVLNLQALEKAKTDLEKIMDSSLDMIFTIDEQGYIVTVSAACKTILGYLPEELTGKIIYDFVHPEDDEKSRQTGIDLLNGNSVINFENRLVRKDGSVANLLWSATWSPKDRLRYSVAKDITGRKKQETALADSEHKYKTLFESHPLPLFIWDFETLQILDCNKVLELKYGYTKAEITTLTLRDIRPPEDIPMLEQAIKNKRIQQQTEPKVWRHRKKNGEIIFVEITSHLIEFNGKTVVLAMANDVTENHYYLELDGLEKRVLEIYAGVSKSLDDVFNAYLPGIEALHPGMLCSLQELRGTKLHNMASPSLPAPFLEVIEGVQIGNKAGSCGTAAFLKQKVIVTDIATDERWVDYKDIAATYGLRACWSQPVLDSDNNVMATFACYFKEVKAPSKLEENTIDRAVHLLQVILESFHKDQALKISNERFEFVTEATSEIIWDWDLVTNGVYYTANMNKLFGHPTGISYNNLPFYYEHVHPADRERVVLYPDQVKYGTMTNWTQEYRFKKADGVYAFVLDRGLVIRDKDGVGIRMVGAMHDITKQKQEERDLKLLESVVTKTNDSIIITGADPLDLDGPSILYVNESFTKMTGYTAEEVVGKTPRILQGPKTDRQELDRLKECLHKGQPCEVTVINYKKNGEEFWVNFSVVPVADETGLYTHLIAIEKDVTEQKNAELQSVLLDQIAQAFTQSPELKESLYRSARQLVQYGNFALAEFWLIDTYKNRINIEAQYYDDARFSDYADETITIKSFAKGEGFPGITWQTQEIQYWNYNSGTKNFVRGRNAKKVGFKRSYSIPLVFNEQVLGALVLMMVEDEIPGLGLSTVFEDFSKRVGAEIRRKQVEDELNQIFNFTPDILCTTSTEGYFTKVNPAMSALLEYDEKELLSRPLIEFVHPSDRIKTANELQNIIEGYPSYYIENRYVTKSGKVKWLAWTTSGASEKGLLFCSAKDITEKKEVEELLNNATSLARIGAWEVDLDRGFVYWSQITREIHEAEANYNPSIDDATSFYKEGTDRDTIVKAMTDAIEYGTPGDVELQIITVKGNTKWVRTIIEAEFTDGKCSRLFGSFQDVDSRRKAELAATEALEERNMILESIDDAFFAVNKKWEVTYWNQVAENVLHTPREMVVNKNLWEVFAESIDSISYKMYHQAVDSNQSVHFEDYFLPLNKWYEISAYPSASGLSVYFKDVTDRKTTEKEILELNDSLKTHARELAISNAELEQFAYVASHDLQEPLRMVTSFLTQLERKYKEVLDDKGKQYIHYAVDGAKRMRQIILDLLEFSRVGQTEDDLVDIDLNKLVTEINILFKKQIHDEKATVEFEDLPVIYTYKTQIRQVLQNLISNSLKYHKKGTPPIVTIFHEETNTQWIISVKDNGIGISQDYFDKIFIIFQRLHNKDEYSGTGMGLAIAKKIVENLGGKIWLTSDVGMGTTFNFTIPKKV